MISEEKIKQAQKMSTSLEDIICEECKNNLVEKVKRDQILSQTFKGKLKLMKESMSNSYLNVLCPKCKTKAIKKIRGY